MSAEIPEPTNRKQRRAKKRNAKAGAAKRDIRVVGVRRKTIDVEKFSAAIVGLAKKMTAEEEAKERSRSRDTDSERTDLAA